MVSARVRIKKRTTYRQSDDITANVAAPSSEGTVRAALRPPRLHQHETIPVMTDKPIPRGRFLAGRAP